MDYPRIVQLVQNMDYRKLELTYHTCYCKAKYFDNGISIACKPCHYTW